MMRRPRGQALAETCVLLLMLALWAGLFDKLAPDALAAIQTTVDSWSYSLALPFP